jgi:hypothetical protein
MGVTSGGCDEEVTYGRWNVSLKDCRPIRLDLDNQDDKAYENTQYLHPPHPDNHRRQLLNGACHNLAVPTRLTINPSNTSIPFRPRSGHWKNAKTKSASTAVIRTTFGTMQRGNLRVNDTARRKIEGHTSCVKW